MPQPKPPASEPACQPGEQADGRSRWRQRADQAADYLWLTTRYQFITKLPFVLVVLPVYKLTITWLITSTGQPALNSSNVTAVLLTPQGLLIGLLSALVVLLGTATDITAFVLIEATRLETGRLPTARQALIAALSTIRRYAHPSTLLFLVYLVIVVPLSGVGFSIELFSRVAVPDFVKDVIHNSLTYTVIYFSILVIFGVIGACGTFIFHAIALDACNPWQAYRRSAVLVQRNIWPIIKLIGTAFIVAAITLIIFISVALVVAVSLEVTSLPVFWKRYGIFFVLFHIITFLGVISFYFPALLLFHLTRMYTRIRPTDWATPTGLAALPPPAPRPTAKIYRKLAAYMAVVSVGIAFLGLPAVDLLDEQPSPHMIPVIAHRGGGNLGPENTVAGLNAAIEKGIPWSEIDVQRTKDGGYIINHDRTFERLSGSSATPQMLTTKEATSLPVANTFSPGQSSSPGQPSSPSQSGAKISTLEEMLVTAKGKIKLFIELKGETADRRMADDVVALVNQYQMRDEVVIIGLDADLMTYVETTYPEVATGFIYFFSVGDIASLPADYLLMEQAEVSSNRIHDMHKAGKKVVVWTVNSVDTLEEISYLPLDGIITDIPTEIQTGLANTREKHDFERILDLLFIAR